MTAMPADLPPAEPDPLDPARIVRALPVGDREEFLAGYRALALEAARDPAGWRELRRFLRLQAFRAIAMSRPGYFEAREAAQSGTGCGLLLDDALRMLGDGSLDDYLSEHPAS